MSPDASALLLATSCKAAADSPLALVITFLRLTLLHITTMDSSTASLAAVPARLAWVTIIALAAVFLGYASKQTDDPEMAELGGLSASLNSADSWDWHLLLMLIAFPVLMLEALLSFKAPLLPL